MIRRKRKKLIILVTVMMMLVCLTAFSDSGNAEASYDSSKLTGTDSSSVGDESFDSGADQIDDAVITAEDDFETLAEKFAGQTIGTQIGTVFDVLINKYIPDASVEYFNSNADLALALDTGKISAYAADEPMSRLLCQTYTDQAITGTLAKSQYGYIYPKNSNKSDTIRLQMNEYLKKIKSDGTIEQIEEIWFGSDESLKVVDTSDLTGENGCLDFAIVSSVGAPFVYVKDNSYVGYDVDIAVRFCREYGYDINIIDSSVGGLFSNVSSGLVDFGAASVVITDERKETMDFSDPNYEGSVVLVTKNAEEDSSDKIGLFESIGNSFKKTFIREDRWKMFAKGLGVTVLLSLLSAIFGSALGFVLFLLYRKNHKIANGIMDKISAFLQMTPVVVILMIFYYLILARTGLSGIIVSIIAFSLMFACDNLNLYNAAVKTIDIGQIEAVRALGYKDTRGFLRIILPQILPHFLSGYKGAIVGLIKSTSIVSYVTVQDLTMITDIIRSRTYEAFFPLVATAAVYFLFAWLLVKLVGRIEVKINPENRKEDKILKGITKND